MIHEKTTFTAERPSNVSKDYYLLKNSTGKLWDSRINIDEWTEIFKREDHTTHAFPFKNGGVLAWYKPTGDDLLEASVLLNKLTVSQAQSHLMPRG